MSEKEEIEKFEIEVKFDYKEGCFKVDKHNAFSFLKNLLTDSINDKGETNLGNFLMDSLRSGTMDGTTLMALVHMYLMDRAEGSLIGTKIDMKLKQGATNQDFKKLFEDLLEEVKP